MNCACLRNELCLRHNSNHGAMREIMMRSINSWHKVPNHNSEPTMKENLLIDLSKQFAVDIVNLCTQIKEHRKGNVLLNQLLRSGTSIGANIHEANYAASKADFVNKFQIALKECYETDYWLELFHRTNIITPQEYATLFQQCSKLRKLLIASITTAKKNL